MDNNNPRVAIIMLGYNSKDNLSDAFESVLKQTYPNYELIFIDNNSSDGSLEYLRNNYPGVRTVKNKENLGFAAAYKNALQRFFQENFDCIILLNPDVIVAENWLEELVKASYSSEKIAFAQPKIFIWENNPTSILNTDGNKINYLGFGFSGNYRKEDSQENTSDRRIAFASGCSLLAKKDAYFAAGELDEDFFAYNEDQDIGWRSNLMGYESILAGKSVMWHKYNFQMNSKNKLKFYLLERNRLYFLFKNYSFKTIAVIFPMLIFMELGVLTDSIIKGYFNHKLRGYKDLLSNLRRLRIKRKKIQTKRKKTDRELFGMLSPTIDFEDIHSPLLSIANFFLRCYYNLVRYLI